MLPAGAVHVVVKIDDAFALAGRLEEYRARAVAEEHAGPTILVIEDRAHRVAADDKHFLVRARAHELRANGQRIREARTCRG